MLDSQSTVRTSASLVLFLAAVTGAAPLSRASAPTDENSVEWLREYVRTDSSTVEGSRRAGSFLRKALHEEGVATKWIVAPTGQPFLYARAGSTAPDARTVILLHHLDVVPPGVGWSRSPFAAEVFEGNLFGRGTIDDKSLGVAQLVSFLRFRQLTNPANALALLAVGGEETGGAEGMGWLVDNHPELFENVTAVLTEGGTNRVYGKKLAWWGIEVAQKRPLWLLARAYGRSGHGSSLNLHSAPHRLLRGLGRLVDRPLDLRLSPEARLFLESLAPLESPAFASVIRNLDAILVDDEPITRLLPGLPNYLLDTIQVNVLEAGADINVMPDTAQAQIDIRLLPDTDEEEILQSLRELIGPDVELEVLLSSPRVAPSPTDSSIFPCLESVLGAEAPVIPAFITAITDARYLREREIPVYGFSPFRLDTNALRGIHSSDEYIPLDAFAEGLETMWDVVSACAGS